MNALTRQTAAVRLMAGDREPVRLASTANLPLAGLSVVDGVQTVANDRVLVKAQTDARQNGIYTASAGTWRRAGDSHSGQFMIAGMKCAVQEGTAHGGDVWNLVTNKPNIGTDAIHFEFYLSATLVADINALVESSLDLVAGQAADILAAAWAATNAADFPSRFLVTLVNVPTGLTYLRTAGYTLAGDGGGALYKKVASEPSHGGKVMSANGLWWEYVVIGPVNIKQFGGVADGSTPNDDAFDDAWSVVSTKFAPVYFPGAPLEYAFDAKIDLTLPDWKFGLAIYGDGSGNTRLLWNNADGGISVTGSIVDSPLGNVSHNTVDFKGFKILTGVLGGGTGIYLFNGGMVNTPPSIIQDVVIEGVDFMPAPIGAKYWTKCIHDKYWNNLILDRVSGQGQASTDFTTNKGIGLELEGDVTQPGQYLQSVKVTNCNFGYTSYGLVLGSYWQGLLFDKCNIAGGSAVYAPVGLAGALAQLGLVNCIFYGADHCINFGSDVMQMQLIGSNLGISEGGVVVDTGPSSQPMIIGNSIGIFNGSVEINGLNINGHQAIVQGNLFYMNSLGSGVILGPASTSCIVEGNQYFGTPSPYANLGTGNYVGVARP